MTLRVLDPGLYTLVVDFGRPHCRSLGVPVGGAADRTSLMLGNALVGNPPDAAALEFSLIGPTLKAGCDLACVVYGAPFQLHSIRQKLTVGKTFTLHSGEVLRIAGCHQGMRGYLCVRGGLRTKPILGSRSSLKPLQATDELDCQPGRIGAHFFRRDFDWEKERDKWLGSEFSSAGEWMLRVLMGPQADWFPLRHRFHLPADEFVPPMLFRILPASNRMGLRLEGPALPFPDRELVSEPVCPGAIQVTRDGQYIVLGVDGQTIGGYPKIAQVISADLDLLGQLRPGDRVFFVCAPQAEAERFYREKQAELRAWVTRLRAAVGEVQP
jgi:antagonist of KipI